MLETKPEFSAGTASRIISTAPQNLQLHNLITGKAVNLIFTLNLSLQTKRAQALLVYHAFKTKDQDNGTNTSKVL